MTGMLKRRGLALAALLAAALMPAAAVRADAQAKKKVAILSWNDKEPRYITTKNAALKEAAAEGFDASKVTFFVEDLEGKKDKVASSIEKLKARDVDLIFALGTSAVVPAAKEIKDKPIIFGMVYDPIGAKIINDWASPGTNVTGGSNFVSVPAFMRRLIKRSEGTQTFKKLAVLYTPGEKNSELQLKDVQSVEAELGVTVTPIPVNDAKDVAGLDKSLQGIDLAYVTGANPIGANIAAIIDATIKRKVVTCTHLEDLVERGVMYGLVADGEEVGKLAGEVMAKVLSGKDPAKVPAVYPTPKLLINAKTAKAGGFKIPPAIKQWAEGSAKS